MGRPGHFAQPDRAGGLGGPLNFERPAFSAGAPITAARPSKFMTKLEICEIESRNSGQINLFPEGMFYKAYQQSAWLLCTRVHLFKVSARPLKGLDGPLLSVGFPMSSLEKFSAGYSVIDNLRGGGINISISMN